VLSKKYQTIGKKLKKDLRCICGFAVPQQLAWAQETPQYQTLKRIQKTFLVRCNVGASTTFS